MVSKIAQTINQIKENPSIIDSLLCPGKQLADFDRSKLRIETLPTGFPTLDKYKILKRGRGELVLIGARPSMGKSALAFQIATNVARTEKVHIFSIEMDHESVAARQMAHIMGESLDYIQMGGAERPEGAKAQDQLAQCDIVIDDRAGLNVYQLCDAARMQHKKSPTSLIVIDYIQIINAEQNENRAQAVAKISWELKSLAKELRIPILALSQLNRQSEFREGGRPQLGDLKESGSLEQDADVVCLIHRAEDLPGKASVIVAKNRNGATGEAVLVFAPAQCRFIDESGSELD